MLETTEELERGSQWKWFIEQVNIVQGHVEGMLANEAKLPDARRALVGTDEWGRQMKRMAPRLRGDATSDPLLKMFGSWQRACLPYASHLTDKVYSGKEGSIEPLLALMRSWLGLAGLALRERLKGNGAKQFKAACGEHARLHGLRWR